MRNYVSDATLAKFPLELFGSVRCSVWSNAISLATNATVLETNRVKELTSSNIDDF